MCQDRHYSVCFSSQLPVMSGKNLIASPFRTTFICFLCFNISSKGEFLQQGNADSLLFANSMIEKLLSFKMKSCAQKRYHGSQAVLLYPKGDSSHREPSVLRFNCRLGLRQTVAFLSAFKYCSCPVFADRYSLSVSFSYPKLNVLFSLGVLALHPGDFRLILQNLALML